MILLPAIDLMGGEVVRLKQGKASEKTVYATDTVAVAKRWESEGGGWLHIVDLDAALTGLQSNLEVVREIARSIAIPCELGGGLRDADAIDRALDAGVRRVVIGTRAAESLDFVAEMVWRFGGDKIAVGIDARDGVVMVKGWTESSGIPAVDMACRVEDTGARTIIYTDVATDGMLEGPNLGALAEIAAAVRIDVIASGGVSRIDDVRALIGLPGISGAIIGKALYEGCLSLREAADLVAGAER